MMGRHKINLIISSRRWPRYRFVVRRFGCMLRSMWSFGVECLSRANLASHTIGRLPFAKYALDTCPLSVRRHGQHSQLNCNECACAVFDFLPSKYLQNRHFWPQKKNEKKRNGISYAYLWCSCTSISPILDWKIDNRWIFLQEKCIFSESLDVKNDELGQFSDFESFQKTVLVRFVLFFGDTIEFRQQLI